MVNIYNRFEGQDTKEKPRRRSSEEGFTYLGKDKEGSEKMTLW